MKLEVLRRRRHDEGRAAGLRPDQVVERVTTFATGTPVANSLGELWVMQNYLRPDLLAAAGVADINDWGATFTAPVSTVEVNATGTSLDQHDFPGRQGSPGEQAVMRGSERDRQRRRRGHAETGRHRPGSARLDCPEAGVRPVDSADG